MAATDAFQACLKKIGSGSANKRINMLYNSAPFFSVVAFWFNFENLRSISESVCMCLIEHYVNI